MTNLRPIMGIATQDLDAMLARLPSHPAVAGLKKTVSDSFAVAQRFAAQCAAHDKDNRLSNVGRADAMKDALRKSYGRELKQAQAPIRKAKERLETLRNGIQPKSLDPSDVVTAMRRMEIRSFVAALPLPDRMQYALKAKDKRIVEALLDAPAEISGVPEDVFAVVRETYLAEHFPAQLSEVTALEEGIEAASVAATLARDDLARMMEEGAGMDRAHFDRLLTPVERGGDVIWLQKHGDHVLVVDVTAEDCTRSHIASEVEIGLGSFFGDYDAYIAAGGAPAGSWYTNQKAAA